MKLFYSVKRLLVILLTVNFLIFSPDSFSQTTLSFTTIPTSDPDFVAPGRAAEQWHDRTDVNIPVEGTNTRPMDVYYRFVATRIATNTQGVWAAYLFMVPTACKYPLLPRWHRTRRRRATTSFALARLCLALPMSSAALVFRAYHASGPGLTAPWNIPISNVPATSKQIILIVAHMLGPLQMSAHLPFQRNRTFLGWID